MQTARPSTGPSRDPSAPGSEVAQPGGPTDPGGAGLVVSDTDGTARDAKARIGGLGDAALAALDGVPGGLLAWTYPAAILGVPGLLLLIAIGAQALGALAWLPFVRRRLGGFGFGGRRSDA